MASSLLVAIGAGLGGMLGWGAADFFAKKAIDEVGDVVSLVWAHLAGAIALAAFAAAIYLCRWHSLEFPRSFGAGAGIACFGTLQAVVYLFVYAGFAKGQISLLNPVFASYSGLVALCSITILGERTTLVTAAALLILFAGILLINLDTKALVSRKLRLAGVAGLPEIAIATVLAAVWTLGWSRFVAGHDGLSFAIWMYFAMTLALFAYAGVRRVGLAFDRPAVWKSLFAIGFCEALGYVAITVGYARSNHASIVALLSGAFSLPTLLLARAFLREKLSPVQVAGVLSLIASIALLARA